MSDLCKRLRDRVERNLEFWAYNAVGLPIPCPSHERDDKRARMLETQAADEIERLREALRPFAEEANRWDHRDDDKPAPVLIGDLRRARDTYARQCTEPADEPEDRNKG